MAYTTINKSKDHFDGKIYLGSSSAVTVTGLEFQPDLVWIKDRDNGNNHCLVDAVRGVGKYIQSDNTSAEVNNSTNSISAFTSDGFTVGTGNPANESASTTKGFMSWNWKANGQGSSNTAGSINTTYTSVNTTAGFSICKWTGNATNSTIGHGLGAVPKVVIIKNLSNGSAQWVVYHVSTGNTQACYLNTNSTPTDVIGFFNDTTPTSSFFTVGTDTAVNGSGNEMIAYCFAEKTGYSKFGSYEGTNNSNGPFVYTGFKPSFILIKNIDHTKDWNIWDDKRDIDNPLEKKLAPSTSGAESTDLALDFLSNGFKLRQNGSNFNDSYTYIYMAFGQSIVGSNNVPCTAR